MPGRDGTGPMGRGAMMGRGMGWCGGVNARADMPPTGRGFGAGRRGGRRGGWQHRHWFHATGLTGWQRAQMGWPEQGAGFTPALSDGQELAALKQQAERLEQTLGALKAKVQELERPAGDAPVPNEK